MKYIPWILLGLAVGWMWGEFDDANTRRLIQQELQKHEERSR